MFTPTSTLNRSPANKSSPPTVLQQTKRQRQYSNDDEREGSCSKDPVLRILEELKASNAAIESKLDIIKKEGDLRYRELRESIEGINSSVSVMDQKLAKIDDKVENNTKEISKFQKTVNWMLQEKLVNKVEINGIKVPRSGGRDGLKEAVLTTLSSINVKVEPNEIKSVYSGRFPIKKGATEMKDVVTVEFQDLTTKARVMKDRRDAKDPKNIYLSDALTAQNRSLMGKVKDIAKDKSFSVFMRGSKINVKKNDGYSKAIECEKDLMVVKNWSPNKKRSGGSRNAQ